MTGAAAAWLALFLAGALEIIWAYGLKQADGFTRFWPSVGTVAAIGLSFGFMAVALKSIPFGTAYAVWRGIGVAGTVIVGIVGGVARQKRRGPIPRLIQRELETSLR